MYNLLSDVLDSFGPSSVLPFLSYLVHMSDDIIGLAPIR